MKDLINQKAAVYINSIMSKQISAKQTITIDLLGSKHSISHEDARDLYIQLKRIFDKPDAVSPDIIMQNLQGIEKRHLPHIPTSTAPWYVE